MHTSIALSVLLGAGAIAHPHFKLKNPLAHVHHKRQEAVEHHTTTIGNQVIIEDIYVTTIGGSPPPPPATTSAAEVAPKQLEVAPVPVQNYNVQPNNEHHHDAPAPVITPAPTTTPAVKAPPVTTSAAPVQQSSPSGGNDGAPKSGGKSILESANKFRALMGFPAFTYSQTLGANAAKTNDDNGANSMTHQLNAGSMAQCITQVDNNEGAGGYTPFELSYLGWLCEIDDGRLGNMCQIMKDATNMIINKSDPGHAKILRDPQYEQMGCNYLTSTQHHDDYTGMWTCDFA